MKVANFNFVAPFYDLLVRVFFGKSLQKAQQFHLKKIKPDEKVLILGGGTGQILDWIPKGCEVTYLELSEVMIKRAKRHGKANFVMADFLTHPIDQKFAWILCPFFLDCFNEANLKRVLEKIRQALEENGRIIVTDFRASNWRQRLISILMIWFFRLISNLESRRLLPIQNVLSQTDFIQKESHFFRNGFIFSDIYRKKETF